MSTPETTPPQSHASPVQPVATEAVATAAAAVSAPADGAAPDTAAEPTHPAVPATAPEGPPAKSGQPRNPLHGVTLEAVVVALADYFGWDELGQRIPIRCFQSDPSVGSSLKFLRKTPWAREKVESLYLFMLRDQKRNGEG